MGHATFSLRSNLLGPYRGEAAAATQRGIGVFPFPEQASCPASERGIDDILAACNVHERSRGSVGVAPCDLESAFLLQVRGGLAVQRMIEPGRAVNLPVVHMNGWEKQKLGVAARELKCHRV